MSDTHQKCLDTFPRWLASLCDDGLAVLAALEGEELEGEGLSDTSRKGLIGGLNYTFTSLDLVPDVIADIGYLDDAFVLRLAAKNALKESNALAESVEKPLERLAADATLIDEFLGKKLFERFSSYVVGLSNGAARGRTVDEISKDPEVFAAFAKDFRGFAGEYKTPEFSSEEKNLVKLKAFFEAKLP